MVALDRTAPRRRTPKLVTRTLALMLALAAGCSSCSHHAATPTRAKPHPKPTPPQGLVWDGSVGGGEAMLDQVRTRFGTGPLHALVPATPAGLLARFAKLPDGVADRIAPGAAVWALGMRRDGGERIYFAGAVRIHVDGGPHPLGATVPLVAGGPDGSEWVGARSEPGVPAIALTDDVLVVAQDPETLTAALPWLAWKLVPEKAERGFSIRVVDGVVSGQARALADGALARRSQSALASAREARAHHDTPPALGDPEALVGIVHDALAHLIAFLPDVGETTLRLVPSPVGLELSIEGAVRSGSPLARTLAALPVGRPFGLAALPNDVALAWAFRHGPTAAPATAPAAAGQPPEGTITKMLARVGGDRFPAPAQALVARAEASVDGAGGTGTVVAFGARAAGPWALFARGGATGAPDAEALRKALSTDYVATVAGIAAGCKGNAQPSAFAGSDAARTATLCTPAVSTGPTPRLVLARSTGAFALAFEQVKGDTPLGVAAGTAGRLGHAGGSESDGLGAAPDVQRGLDALGDHVLLAGVLTPSRLVPAAGVLAVAPLRRAASTMAAAGKATPIVFGAIRSHGAVRLDLELSPASIEDLTSALVPLLQR